MIQLNDVVAVVKFVLLTSTIVSSVFVAIMASVSSELDGSEVWDWTYVLPQDDNLCLRTQLCCRRTHSSQTF